MKVLRYPERSSTGSRVPSHMASYHIDFEAQACLQPGRLGVPADPIIAILRRPQSPRNVRWDHSTAAQPVPWTPIRRLPQPMHHSVPRLSLLRSESCRQSISVCQHETPSCPPSGSNRSDGARRQSQPEQRLDQPDGVCPECPDHTGSGSRAFVVGLQIQV